jgi:FtsH-binding integral membrane protein
MELMKNIANLIKVKTLVTMVVIIVFAVLALTNRIPAEQVMLIVSMVLSFYFGTQSEKNDKKVGE